MKEEEMRKKGERKEKTTERKIVWLTITGGKAERMFGRRGKPKLEKRQMFYRTEFQLLKNSRFQV